MMGELLLAIRAEEQRLAGSYASEYQIAKAREAEVATAIAKLAGETEKKSRAEVKMRDIESSADTFRQLYSNFLQKFQEMNTNQTQAIAIEDARIVTRASPALNRNSRRASAVLAGSLIMGLLLGAGAAIARELTADVFRTPNVVRDVTGIHRRAEPDAGGAVAPHKIKPHRRSCSQRALFTFHRVAAQCESIDQYRAARSQCQGHRSRVFCAQGGQDDYRG
jgi:hypothetical protein